MQIGLFLRVLVVATSAGLVQASDPPDQGPVTWAEGYPKAIAAKPGETKGAIEVLGGYKFKPGWTVKEVQFSVTPKAGGTRSEPIKLKYADGKWGELDPKDKAKMVPAQMTVARGEWSVWIACLVTGKDESGQQVTKTWLAMIKNVEVK